MTPSVLLKPDALSAVSKHRFRVYGEVGWLLTSLNNIGEENAHRFIIYAKKFIFFLKKHDNNLVCYRVFFYICIKLNNKKSKYYDFPST